MPMLNCLNLVLVALIPILGILLLPPDVSSHFDVVGKADASLPKGVATILFTLFAVAVIFVPTFLAKIWDSALGVRNARVLRVYGTCFGVYSLLLWILVIFANTLGSGRLPVVATWLVGVVLFLPLVLFLVPDRRSVFPEDR